ncbi:VOC family protein [Oceanomicrobium pacificus]|uniref:VOC family protein n=1 Tax=Oceanomicrobium pacificus TaxID=2692916 RepID=A0A6B0TMT7_9RHOB|nr:VOC family protein [Oceanomicrobium pacificus]MXU65837.1 VOC family protein [Oceanomicrobium pacificus]
MDLNQVTIDVAYFKASVDFYLTLGFRLIVSARGEYARFELPSGTSTFSLHLSDAPRVGGTVLYFEVADVDATHADLKARGIRFDSPPTSESWLWREARFTDPTGHRLCLYHAGDNRRHPPWRLDP